MGTIPGMMGFNPMSGTSSDFATMMLMQQMQNSGGQSVWGAGWNGNVANGINNVAPVEGEVPQKGGFSFTKSLGYAAVGGGAVGAGMLFTNNRFNSAIGENGKFNEKFLKSFAGEYAQLKNGNKFETFLKGLSNTKTPVTAENFGATFDSIEDFIKSGDVDNLTDEAKQVLKKQFSLTKVDKSTLQALHNTKLGDMKSFYSKTIFGLKDHLTVNDLNAHKGLLNQLDDIGTNWKALGKGADSIADKLSFLKSNAHALGMSADDYATLMRNADDITNVKELDDLFRKYGSKSALKTRKTALGKEISKIEKGMQSYATKWDKNAGFWGQKGFKTVGDKKTLEGLNRALKSMRKSKAAPIALGAAAVSAIVSCFM